MYIQRDEENVAILLTPFEVWTVSSLAAFGLHATADQREITALMALQDAFLVLDDSTILELAMEEESLHGHTQEELEQLRDSFKAGIKSFRDGDGAALA